VLPVVLRPISLDQVPPYLRAVTFLKPKGGVAAEVADAVHRVALERQRSGLKAIAIGVAAAIVVFVGAYAYWLTSAPDMEITGNDGAPAVIIPAGNFTMGDNEDSPQREVNLRGFYLDKYEVTVARYANFLKARGAVNPPDYWEEARHDGAGELPVVGVAWHEADAYCRWAGKRLPTDAEWEKAARGINGRKYPWGNDAPVSARANFGRAADDPYQGGLMPVSGREAGKSPYGAEDLAGNVSEWVADWFTEAYRPGDVRNPTGPESGSEKVIRGGGWQDPPDRLKSTRRMHASPVTRAIDVGFRCAKDAPE
jgi:formylglycine-generating enzyme required for sulfatase activity